MTIGLITGSGLGRLQTDTAWEEVGTPYGPALVGRWEVGAASAFVLPRHGPGHKVPPHRINYRANVKALQCLGCETVIATNAVGSLRADLAVGDFVLPDQFLDMTRQRPLTFFDGEDGRVLHTDVTEPYCPRLRGVLQPALASAGLTAHQGGTYLCTEGPRFETPAEIRMFAGWGADVVGMTGLPEVVLAREAGLCYATVCVVSNLAAGLAPGPLSDTDITAVAAERFVALWEVLAEVLATLSESGDPHCCARRSE
jgi:5'-methylthioadenosine phosphorylase